ncbi:MAG: helix-turn-helix transcriptional regulator [Paludibacteraceae bacterium]|nr:helix-turn-helix transcriptional regulator [Paludibacteraceae bacterium]
MNTPTELERLQALMKTENLNAKDFATEVGISPSTMSNILSGRNKPSLDVLQRVLTRFRLVSPEWLILGIGSMYKSKNAGQDQTLFDIAPTEPDANKNKSEGLPGPTSAIVPDGIYAGDVYERGMASNEKRSRKENHVVPETSGTEKYREKKIKKVIVFFDDGSFDEISKE